MGAASAAAIAAVAAGLTPKVHSLHPSLFQGENKRNGSVIRDINGNTTHEAPGLTMGLGLGIANGVAATISAALFPSHNNTSHHQHHSAETHHQPTSRIPPPTIAAAAVASVVSPPLKDLGIHQVEGSDGTQGKQNYS